MTSYRQRNCLSAMTRAAIRWIQQSKQQQEQRWHSSWFSGSQAFKWQGQQVTMNAPVGNTEVCMVTTNTSSPQCYPQVFSVDTLNAFCKTFVALRAPGWSPNTDILVSKELDHCKSQYRYIGLEVIPVGNVSLSPLELIVESVCSLVAVSKPTAVF